ncbi:MAG: hypothetical protein IT452_11735 [Planctomycetia bacterium]|nr:hypothetical protein [Planctomycetia bacterium]
MIFSPGLILPFDIISLTSCWTAGVALSPAPCRWKMTIPSSQTVNVIRSVKSCQPTDLFSQKNIAPPSLFSIVVPSAPCAMISASSPFMSAMLTSAHVNFLMYSGSS